MQNSELLSKRVGILHMETHGRPVGSIVNSADIVGTKGNSPGGTTSVHLHFAIYRVEDGDKRINLHPIIADIIDHLAFYGIPVSISSIRESGMFTPRALSRYTWSRSAQTQNLGPVCFTEIRGNPSMNPLYIAKINDSFGLSPV